MKTIVRAAGNQSGDQGFSLVEIVMAVAIISTALVTLLGILPVGLDASRKATNHSVVASVLEDIHNRLQGEVLEPGQVSISPAYFDEQGVYLPAGTAADELNSRRRFRADIVVGTWRNAPDHISSFKPVTITLSWALDAVGNPLPDEKSRLSVTFGATSLSGPDWKSIDPSYKSKIEY